MGGGGRLRVIQYIGTEKQPLCVSTEATTVYLSD